MSADLWAFDFSTAIVAPPTSNQLRIEYAFPYANASRVWVRDLTTDGIDAFVALMNIGIGDTLYIQDRNNHASYGSFTVTGRPIDKVDYVEIPVALLVANGTPLPNNQACVLAVVEPEAVVAPTPPPGTPLVTLQQIKDHLGITAPDDAAGDADVIAKLAEAQAHVLDYIGSTAYWRAIAETWTAATVPAYVQAAIKLQCAKLYRFRGDDVTGAGPERLDEAEDLPRAVRDLLRRTRDPVIA